MSWDWEQNRRDERLARDIGNEVGEAVGDQLEVHLGKLSEDIVGAIGTQSQMQAYLHEERLWFDTLSKEQKIEYLEQKQLEQQRQIEQARRVQVIHNETLQLQQTSALEQHLAGDLNWWQSVFSVLIRPILGIVVASTIVSVLASTPSMTEAIGDYLFGIWLLVTVIVFLLGKPFKRRVIALLTSANRTVRKAKKRKANQEYQNLMEARKKFQ